MTARLHIERKGGGYVDRWRAYEVIVNGQPRAELKRGEHRTLEIDPGHVEVFLRIDWCRSRVMRMDLTPGAEKHLICRPRSLLTAFYGIIFARDNYVQLHAV
jgi:hypothetical protein